MFLKFLEILLFLIGDVVGAPFPVDPRNPVGLNALRIAEPVKSSEHIMFDFAYNLYTLHYLRRTNQLRVDTMRKMLEYLNRGKIYKFSSDYFAPINFKQTFVFN